MIKAVFFLVFLIGFADGAHADTKGTVLKCVSPSGVVTFTTLLAGRALRVRLSRLIRQRPMLPILLLQRAATVKRTSRHIATT
jgi:hypothetical protein